MLPLLLALAGFQSLRMVKNSFAQFIATSPIVKCDVDAVKEVSQGRNHFSSDSDKFVAFA
ncbi:MAG: hypothetical protein NW220_06960 [Leptolyngbyaceae cyanobacterium bins.349]|nr:hypothetical protein [Leptolyngbyaceae cyanobacterium bins.349]